MRVWCLKGNTYKYDKVTAPASTDPYELHYNEDPFHIEGPYKEARMKEGTTMVPRVFKTNVGDIFTTNTVNAETLAVGDVNKAGVNFKSTLDTTDNTGSSDAEMDLVSSSLSISAVSASAASIELVWGSFDS